MHFGACQRGKIFPVCNSPRPQLRIRDDKALANKTAVKEEEDKLEKEPRKRPTCKPDEETGAPDPILNVGMEAISDSGPGKPPNAMKDAPGFYNKTS